MIDTLTLADVSRWAGVLAAALLAYRMLAHWATMGQLSRALGVTLLLVIVGQAYGSTQTLRAGTPLQDDVVAVIFACRLAVIALCVLWPWRDTRA